MTAQLCELYLLTELFFILMYGFVVVLADNVSRVIAIVVAVGTLMGGVLDESRITSCLRLVF